MAHTAGFLPPPRISYLLFASLMGAVGCWGDAGGADDQEGGLTSDELAFGQPAFGGDLAHVTPSAVGDMSTEELVEVSGEPGSSGRPKVVYLAYADGKPLPRTSPNPCSDTAPRFVCDFAPSVVECQRQIQAYLDKWYADFNVVFTLTRPTSGTFYTEVVSSGGGAWCDAASNVAGIAPFLCGDLAGGVAYTFLGGKNAKETAIIIAQEQAHLVGLEHTVSTRDIMDPTICPHCDGFEDVDNKIHNDHCNRDRQNSYELMKKRLGAWTGGIKPTPFGCSPDNAPPLVQILAPAPNATVSGNFVLRVQASDQCKVTQVTVTVAPMGIRAQSISPPFEWTLTNISGVQTITVTASDATGKQSSSSVTVRAGSASGTGAQGGASGSGGTGATGVAPAELDSPDGGCQLGGCGVGGGTDRGGNKAIGWVSLVVSLAGIAVVLASRSRRSPARARNPPR